MDVLRINDLMVDCVVGVYPHERHASQPLRVDIAMHLNTERAATEETVRYTAHYAHVAAHVVFLLRSCRFRLLETAAQVLAKYLLAPPAPDEEGAQIEKVTIRLTKPGALRGFATPSLEIERSKDWCVLGREDRPFGHVDIVDETHDAGIYRLNIAPGRSIPLHHHLQMRESELVISTVYSANTNRVRVGRFIAGHEAPRIFTRTRPNDIKVLCVDLPRFIESDEIEVSGEPADVPSEPPWGPMAAG
ncbi:MAG: dihydroneopterin aldolase [Polyangiales bacterium]